MKESQGMNSRQESKGRNLRAGSEAETWKSAAYCFVKSGLLNMFSYTTQNHLPMSGRDHSGMDSHTLVISQENTHHRVAYGPI